MTDKNKIVKADGYNEIFKGEKRVEQPFYMQGLAKTSLASFYEQDGLAKKIIDVIPEDMVTPGFKVEGIADEAAFRSLWDEKRLNAKIIDALCWSRLFGGSGIVAIVQDGRMLKSPVREGAVLEDIRVYDRYQIRVSKRETNARSVRYGEPVLYTITPGNDIPEYDVHYTRICIIDGERLPNEQRKNNDGWGGSILNKRLIEAIRDYNYCEELASQLLRRKQQAVWKARGLADLCDDDEGVAAARLRLAQVDDESGVGKAIGIDAEDEEYAVLNSDVSGVPEFLQSKFDRIVALTGIHEIVLKNKNTGGVSASQNTALETYHKLIDRKRGEEYKPVLEFILPFLVNESEWSIVFEPLSVPSDKDQAEVLNKNVDSVTKLVQDQLIDTEEARDTLRSMGSIIKIKDTDNIKLPKPETEPEPGTENNQ
ncbi:putative portal protein [Escherichia phage vB_EcoS_W011D]|uniref:Putative portal protein n=1 Tax=Escherichia phage vB_EcoS_W011D TaxID=2575323 RepID=A0A4Y5NR55_9CAUD|nr:putative portal protein [Escherichia phage vB_EcoS_W011D]QCW18456.1 putative portal protein [Escherichia phage vB_EcoS_W011D]